jgi:[acyl-carrier-protein] S-malonyltransferase
MAAVLGLGPEQVEQVCKDPRLERGLVVANLNAPGQVVVSGTRPALEAARSLLREAGARDLVFLKVSAPFHSPWMRSVAEQLRAVLQSVEFRAPACPVVSNVDGCAHRDPIVLRERLVEQLTSPVRFETGVRWILSQGISQFVELGPGNVLAGLVRRIERSSHVVGIDQPGAFQAIGPRSAPGRCAC